MIGAENAGTTVSTVNVGSDASAAMCPTAKTMGKTFRYKNGIPPLGTELDTHPLKEGRRIFPQINGHIKYLAPQTFDDLGFRKGRILIMHAPHSTPGCCYGMVDLDDLLVKAYA